MMHHTGCRNRTPAPPDLTDQLVARLVAAVVLYWEQIGLPEEEQNIRLENFEKAVKELFGAEEP